jgi:hypothetical protein
MWTSPEIPRLSDADLVDALELGVTLAQQGQAVLAAVPVPPVMRRLGIEHGGAEDREAEALTGDDLLAGEARAQRNPHADLRASGRAEGARLVHRIAT